MKNLGFFNVGAFAPQVHLADPMANARAIAAETAYFDANRLEAAVFPELSLTGYSCQDLFRSEQLLEQTEAALGWLLDATRAVDTVIITGMPLRLPTALVNCAVVMLHGRICGVVPKTHLPNYGEFYEKRWFVSSADLQPQTVTLCGQEVEVSGTPQVFRIAGSFSFGVEICEDLWAPVPPSCNLALAGADVIFNLSASDELAGKHNYLRELIRQQSARTISYYVYAGAGYGESTQDVVYDGNAFLCNNGRMEHEAERFTGKAKRFALPIEIEHIREERRANSTFACAQRTATARYVDLEDTGRTGAAVPAVDPTPFIPKDKDMQASCEEILNIQTFGLVRRMEHTHARNVVIGISGGLDSTLALLVAVRACDRLGIGRSHVTGITMPGFGTTGRTHSNAVSLMQSLGVSAVEIPIADSVNLHFRDIGHNPDVHDVTYENCQARERTQILMDMANKLNGMVIGTGDLSELALGWATYNGDHMSMYGVNAGVPKTLIKHLVRYVARYETDAASAATLNDIIDTPISPELIPADKDGNITQKTEDLVGPYELHDFFLYNYLRYGYRPRKLYLLARRAFADAGYTGTHFDDATIRKWLRVFFRRFFAQQFKRSCLPDGPKVGSVSLSPRGDWRMPSDAQSAAWLAECDELENTNH